MNWLNDLIPTIADTDLAFSRVKTDKNLLAEAEKRGFDDWNNAYSKHFSSLFFKGGTLDFKEDLDPEFKSKAFKYFKALASSFEPKHEHKMSVCAMLLSELVNLPSCTAQ